MSQISQGEHKTSIILVH